MGTRENYNESDLLYAQVDNLVHEFNDDFSEIAEFLRNITIDIKAQANELLKNI
jgi:hypothetical protein